MFEHDKVHVTLSLDPQQFATLQQLLTGIQTNQLQEIKDMAALDDQITALQTEVANQTTVNASAVTLLQGLSAQLAAAIAAAGAAGATPAQLAALATLQSSLAGNDSTLAAAVVANTPAAPAGNPPVPPVVPAVK